MSQALNKTSRIVAFIGLFTLFCAAFFGQNFVLWASHIPGFGEDGGKNFFTVAYHILHDSSLFWFEGMNYPFGEHVIFTDNQPLVTNILKLIGGTAYWLPYLVIVSAMIGGLLIFSMLRHETNNNWFSLIAAIGITFLSPQWSRLTGHYSLAYVGLIPLLIYLLWRHHNSIRAVYWSIALGIVIFLFGWIHPYLHMMSVLLWILIIAVSLLAKTKNWKLIDLLWPIACLGLFFFSVELFDTISDRPKSPYGFINYRATWASLLLPLDRPFFQSIATNFTASQEGTFYLGAVAIVGSIMGLIQFIQNRITGFWTLLAIACVPILLLSVAFPFYLPKMDQILPYLGPLKQFRGIGRFSFPVFFAFNLFAVITLFRLIENRTKFQRLGGLMLILFILVGESTLYAMHISDLTKNRHSFKEFDGTIGYKEDFQCILTVPYFHVGSETYRTPNIESLRLASFQLSLNHGLPLAAVQMSRTSLSQTLLQLQLTALKTSTPAILNSYNDKPILILTQLGIELNEYEKELLAVATKFKSLNGFEYYSIFPSDFEKIANANQEKLLARIEHAEILGSGNAQYMSFDSTDSNVSFAGKGALSIKRTDWTELAPQNIHLSNGKEYEISFWFNIAQEQAANTQLWFWERNGDDEVRFEVTEVGDHIEQIYDQWILCTIPFSVNHDGNKVSLMAHRDGISQMLTVDEILLRDTSIDYHKPGNSNLNNRYLSKPNSTK